MSFLNLKIILSLGEHSSKDIDKGFFCFKSMWIDWVYVMAGVFSIQTIQLARAIDCAFDRTDTDIISVSCFRDLSTCLGLQIEL